MNPQLLLLAFVCAIYFMLSIVIAHVVSPDLPALSTTLSRYALEEKGSIIISGFYAIAITQLLLGAYFLTTRTVKRSIPGAVYILLAGLGVIIVAVFPTQPPPAGLMERLPHITGAVMQFFFFPLAAFMFLRKMPDGGFRLYTQLTAFITAALFVTLLGLLLSPSMRGFAYFGLIEKIDILAINFWLIIMSFNTFKSGS